MKVTALIPEALISETRKYSGGKNITESLLIALRDYIGRQRVKRAITKVKANPVKFEKGFTADKVRRLTRDR